MLPKERCVDRQKDGQHENSRLHFVGGIKTDLQVNIYMNKLGLLLVGWENLSRE